MDIQKRYKSWMERKVSDYTSLYWMTDFIHVYSALTNSTVKYIFVSAFLFRTHDEVLSKYLSGDENFNEKFKYSHTLGHGESFFCLEFAMTNPNNTFTSCAMSQLNF